MEEYQWNPNFENLEIFPQQINNDLGLIYHGTSLIYAQDIEANGFRINNSPFPIDDMREIINLLADLGEASNYIPGHLQIDFNHAGAIDHYINNPHPISFTIAGYPALKFASGISKGGQIVGKIKLAIDHIRILISQLPNENIRRIELVERLEGIQYINDQCDEISNSYGVIYVIRPSTEIIPNLYVDHLIVFSKETIPGERIIAKVIVNANYELPANFKTQSESIISKHFTKRNTIGFNLFNNQFEDSDNGEN